MRILAAWFQTHLKIGDLEFPFTPLRFLLDFALPAAAFILGAFVLKILCRRMSRRFIRNKENRKAVGLWSRRVLRLTVVLGISLSLGSLLGADAFAAVRDFFNILNTPFFSSGNTRVSLVTLLLILPVFAAASWTGRVVRRSLNARILSRLGLDAEQSFSIGRLIRYAAMALVFLFGLSILGIDLSAIGVVFGVLGIGIGFGLQSLVADFFAGVALISMGLIKEGDRIRAEGFDGIIRHIRLMNTEMTTFENETLIIPNSRLTGGVIHNFSYKDRRVVIVNRVDVAYSSDLDRVTQLMLEIARDNPWIQKDFKPPVVRVKTFGDSGIQMEVRTWISDVSHQADAESWTNLEIWRRFASERVEIPFPQRVVHSPGLLPDDDLKD